MRDYRVEVLERGKRGSMPSVRGRIFEGDVWIGTFSRKAPRERLVSPMEVKFFCESDRAKFEDFAESESIAEAIEALMGLE